MEILFFFLFFAVAMSYFFLPVLLLDTLVLIHPKYFSSIAVIHDEFLKWDLVGPWLSKNGAHITNYGVSDFVSYHFVKSRINWT